MSLLLYLGGCVSVLVVLYIVEVICLLGRTPHRPSTLIRRVATHLYNGLRRAAYIFGILFDIFGFVRRLLLQLRELLFRWIPVAIIKQAWDELHSALLALLSFPRGLFVGLFESLRDATLPWVSTGLMVVVFLIAPLVWEVVGKASPPPSSCSFTSKRVYLDLLCVCRPGAWVGRVAPDGLPRLAGLHPLQPGLVDWCRAPLHHPH